MKKYEGKKSNVIGNLIKKYREEKGLEDGTQIVKDFELIGLCKVLDVNYDDLKNCIE